MYKKLKKPNKNYSNLKLQNYCSDLLAYNPDATLIISKRFIENANDKGFTEIKDKNIPIIYSSVDPGELLNPRSLTIRKIYEGDEEHYYLTLWCDREIPLARIVHKQLVFTDGDIKGKEIKNLYLDIK